MEMNKMQQTIQTADGEKKFVAELTDDELNAGDYSIRAGYWNTHYNGKHQVYR